LFGGPQTKATRVKGTPDKVELLRDVKSFITYTRSLENTKSNEYLHINFNEES
jgi:hypothetical protein